LSPRFALVDEIIELSAMFAPDPKRLWKNGDPTCCCIFTNHTQLAVGGVTEMLGSAELTRLKGFGACMISGYPHECEGMFEIACELIEKELACAVTSFVVSLGGFPAPRAQKYLANKVLDCNPDYVVFQFGTTDAQRPIRKYRPALSIGEDHPRRPGMDHSRRRPPITYHRKPATALSRIRWELISLLGFLKRSEPITPLPRYIAAVEQMMLQCRGAGAVPVVLSPFVYGSRYTMRNAISYAGALCDLRVTMPDVILVDCIDLLTKVSKSRILMHDGVHLSGYGQEMIGYAIARSIMGHARARWERKAERAA
jgi:hypothetical protein